MSFIDWLGEQKDNLVNAIAPPPPVEEPPAPPPEQSLPPAGVAGGLNQAAPPPGEPVESTAVESAPPPQEQSAAPVDPGYAAEPVGGNDVVYATDSPDPAAGEYRIQDPTQTSPPVEAQPAPADPSYQGQPADLNVIPGQEPWRAEAEAALADPTLPKDPIQQKAEDYSEYVDDVQQGGQDRKRLQERVARNDPTVTEVERSALETGAPLPGAEQEAAAARGNISDSASAMLDQHSIFGAGDARWDAQQTAGGIPTPPPLSSAQITGLNPGDYQSQLTRPVGETFEEEQAAVQAQIVQQGMNFAPGMDMKTTQQLTEERRIARYNEQQKKAARDTAIRNEIYQPQTGVDPNTGQEYTFFAPVVSPKDYEFLAFVAGAQYDAEQAGIDLDAVSKDTAIQEEYAKQASTGIYRDAPFLALINGKMVAGMTEEQGKALLGLIQASALMDSDTFKTYDWNPGGWEGAVQEKFEGAMGLWGAPQNAYNGVAATRLYETLTSQEGKYSFGLKEELFYQVGGPLGSIDTANMTAFYSRDLDGDGRIDAVASGLMEEIFQNGFTDPVSGQHYPGYAETKRPEDGGLALYEAYMAEQNSWTRIVSQLVTDPTIEGEILFGLASGGLATGAAVAQKHGLVGVSRSLLAGAHLMEGAAAATDPVELLSALGRTPKGLRGLLATTPAGTEAHLSSEVGKGIVEALRQREPGTTPRVTPSPSRGGGDPTLPSTPRIPSDVGDSSMDLPPEEPPLETNPGVYPERASRREPGLPASDGPFPDAEEPLEDSGPDPVRLPGRRGEASGRGNSSRNTPSTAGPSGLEAGNGSSRTPVIEGPVTGEATRPSGPASLPMPETLPPDLVVETPKPVRVVEDGVSTPARLPEEPAWLRDDFASSGSLPPDQTLVGGSTSSDNPARRAGSSALPTPESKRPAPSPDVVSTPRLVDSPVHTLDDTSPPLPGETTVDVAAVERQLSDDEALTSGRRGSSESQRSLQESRVRGQAIRRTDVDPAAEKAANPDAPSWRSSLTEANPSLRQGLVVYKTSDAVDVVPTKVGHVVGHQENSLFVTQRTIAGRTYSEVFRSSDLGRPIARFRDEAVGADPMRGSFGVENHVGSYGQALRYAQDVIFREAGSGTAYKPFKRVVNGGSAPSFEGGQGWYILDADGTVLPLPDANAPGFREFAQSQVEALKRMTGPEFSSEMGRALVDYLEDSGVLQKYARPQKGRTKNYAQQRRLDAWKDLLTARARNGYVQETVDLLEADIVDIEQSANRWRKGYAVDAKGENARAAKFQQAQQFADVAKARRKEILEHMAQQGITAPAVSGRIKLPNGDYHYQTPDAAKAHFREFFGESVTFNQFFRDEDFGTPSFTQQYQGQVIGRLIPLFEQYPVAKRNFTDILFYDGGNLDQVDQMLRSYPGDGQGFELYTWAGGRYHQGKLYFNMRPGGKWENGSFVPPTWDRLQRLVTPGMSAGPTHGHGSDLQVITSHEFAHLLDNTLERLDTTYAWKSWKISRRFDNGLIGEGRVDLDYLDEYLQSSGPESLAGVFQTGYLARGVLSLPEFEELDQAIRQISETIQAPRSVPYDSDAAIQFQQLAQTTHFPLGEATRKLLVNENPELPRLPEDTPNVVTPQAVYDPDLPYTPDEVDRASISDDPEVYASAEWEARQNPGAFVPITKTSQGLPVAIGYRGPLPNQGIGDLMAQLEDQLLAPRRIGDLLVDHDGNVSSALNGNRITPTMIGGQAFYPRSPQAFDEVVAFVVKPQFRSDLARRDFAGTVLKQLQTLNVKRVIVGGDIEPELLAELQVALGTKIELVKERAYDPKIAGSGPLARVKKKLQTIPGYRASTLILGGQDKALDILKQGIRVNVSHPPLTRKQARDLLDTPDASGYTPLDKMNAYITQQLDKAGRLQHAVSTMGEGGELIDYKDLGSVYPSIDFSGFEQVMQAWADGDLDIVNWLDDPKYDIEHLTMQRWRTREGSDRPSIMPQYVEMTQYPSRGLMTDQDAELELALTGELDPSRISEVAPWTRANANVWKDAIADRFGSGKPLEAPSRFDTRGDALASQMRQQYELRGNEDLSKTKLPMQQDRLSKMGLREFKWRKEQIKATVVEQDDPVPGQPLKGATSDEVRWKSGDIIAGGTYQEPVKETFWYPDEGLNADYLLQQWAREPLEDTRRLTDWEVRIPGRERVDSGYAQYLSRGEQVEDGRPPLRYSVVRRKHPDGKFRDFITLKEVGTGKIRYQDWGEFPAEHNPVEKFRRLSESLGIPAHHPEELLISADELTREAQIASGGQEHRVVDAVRRYEHAYLRSVDPNAGTQSLTARVGPFDVAQARDGSFTAINWQTLDVVNLAQVLSGYQPRSLMDRQMIEALGEAALKQNGSPSYREVLQQRFDGLFGGDRALADDASVKLSQMVPHGNSAPPKLPPHVRVSEDGHAFTIEPARGKSGQQLLNEERKPTTLGNESAAYQDANRYEDTTSPEYRAKDTRQRHSPHERLDPAKDNGDQADADHMGEVTQEQAFQGNPMIQMLNYTAEFDGQFIRIRRGGLDVYQYSYRGPVETSENGLQGWMVDALAQLDHQLAQDGWPSIPRRQSDREVQSTLASRLQVVGRQLTEPALPPEVSGLDHQLGSLARPIASLKRTTLPESGGFGSEARLTEILEALDPEAAAVELNGVMLAKKIRDWGQRNIPFGNSNSPVEWRVALLDQKVAAGTAPAWERMYLDQDVEKGSSRLVRDHSYVVGSTGMGSGRRVAVLVPPGTKRAVVGPHVVLPRGSTLIDLGTVEGVKTYQVLTPEGYLYLPGPQAKMPSVGLPKAPLVSESGLPIAAPWTRGDFSGLQPSAAIPGGVVASDGSHLTLSGDGSVVRIPADLLADPQLPPLPTMSGLSEASQSYLVSMGTPPVISAYRWPDNRVGYVAFGQDLETLQKLSEDFQLAPEVLDDQRVAWSLWGRQGGQMRRFPAEDISGTSSESLRASLPSPGRLDLPTGTRQPYTHHTAVLQRELGLDHPFVMRPTSDGTMYSVPWLSSAGDAFEHRGDKILVGFLERDFRQHAADWPFLKRFADENNLAGGMDWVGAATLRTVHEDYTTDFRETWAEIIAPKHGIFDGRINDVLDLTYEVYDEATGTIRPVTIGDEMMYRAGQLDSLKRMADWYRTDPASVLPDELIYLQRTAKNWGVEVEDLATMSNEFIAQMVGKRIQGEFHDYLVKTRNLKIPKQMEDRDLLSLPRSKREAGEWLKDVVAEYVEYSKHMALYSNHKGLAFSTLQMVGNAFNLGISGHWGGLNEYFNPLDVKTTWQNLGDDVLMKKVERMSSANRVRKAAGLGPSKRLSAHHIENPSSTNYFGKRADLAKTPARRKAWKAAEYALSHPAWQRLGQVWDTQIRDSIWLDTFSRRSRVASFHMQTHTKKKLADALAAGHHGIGITEAHIDQAFDTLRSRNGGFFDGRALGIQLLEVSGATDNTSLNFAKRIGKDWHRTMRGLDDLAQEEVERVAFSFRARGIDEKLGNLVFFHYWSSRAMALYGSELLKNPWMMNAFFNMWEEMEYEADRSGRRDNFFGYFGLVRSVGSGLWNSPFGYLAMFNLPQSLGPISQVMDTFQEGDSFAKDQSGVADALDKNPFMLHPLVGLLLGGVGVLGKDPQMADVSGLKGMQSLVTDVLNVSLLAPAGRAYTGGMPTDVAQQRAVWFLSNGIDQLTQGLPILNLLEGTRDADLGATNGNEITWEMHSVIAEENPGASKLEINQILKSELLRGMDSPVWREATNNWAKKNLAEASWNFALPARVKLVEQEKADYQKGNVDKTNTAHEYFTADAASRADLEDLVFDYDNYIWKEGLGTEETRKLDAMKTGIWKGDLPDGVTVTIRGQDYTSAELKAMPETLRSDLSEEYLDEHGGTDARMALYDLDLERLDYLQDHPLVSTYWQWSDALTGATAGLESSVAWLRAHNPGYEEYMRTVELNAPPGTEDWKLKAIDKEGFQAAMGMEWNAYTDTLEVDGHPVSRESLESLTQTGQEQATERYGYELNDKQRLMAEELPENADRALSIMASLDALDPSGYSKQLWIDKAHGLRKDERLPYDVYASLKTQYGDTFVPRAAVDYALWEGRTSNPDEKEISRFLYENNQDYWDQKREERFSMRAQGMDEETITAIQEMQRAAESLAPPSSSGKSWSDAGTYDKSKDVGGSEGYVTEGWSGSSTYGSRGANWSRDYRRNQWDRGESVSPTDFLNLRTGPGLSHESRMVLHAGDDLFVLGEDFMDGERWVRVRTSSGQVGWVMSKFLGRGKRRSPRGLDDLGERIEATVKGRVAARRR